jgi:hypothetical protein
VHLADFGTRCESCHGSIRWTGLPERVGREAHARARFPLAGAHAGVDCARCHRAGKYRGIAFARCDACHRDPHPGDPAADCAACHRVEAFYPSTFTVAQHATTALPLDGRHAAVPCLGCHAGARPRLELRSPRRACAECHADPHGEEIAPALRAGGCAGCHSTAGWERPKVDHAIFPLTGAHADVACAACHAKKVYRGTPRACAGCHADAHAGQLGGRACDACHGTASFAIARFDHQRLAGVALDGKHAGLACASCHPPVALGAQGVIRYRLGYRRCADCHADPHAGSRFADLDCSACHGTAGWRLAGGRGFDHARTGFPLSGGHGVAACADCHRAGRATPRACAGCHADPHEGRLGVACDACHGPADFKDTRARERHARTRLPLTGAHALLDCAACHVAAAARTWSDVPAACFACHEDDYRRPGLHPTHDGSGGAAPFPQSCEVCHRPLAWTPAVIAPALVLRALGGGGGEAHERRFPIRAGRHAGAACADCHPSPETPRRVACAGCHATGRHRPGIPALEGTCLTCHPRGTR